MTPLGGREGVLSRVNSTLHPWGDGQSWVLRVERGRAREKDIADDTDRPNIASFAIPGVLELQ